jgi:hypothetical protein
MQLPSPLAGEGLGERGENERINSIRFNVIKVMG